MPVYPYILSYGELTCKAHRLYVHVFRKVPMVELLNIQNNISRVWMLETGEELEYHTGQTCEGDGFVRIRLPEGYKERAYYCVGLELEEEMPQFHPIQG